MSGLIDRQALCEYALNQKDKSITPNEIMRFPSAEPVRHGKWESLTFTNASNEEYTMHRCSECGLTIVTGWYHYCPNCGARMDDGNRNE